MNPCTAVSPLSIRAKIPVAQLRGTGKDLDERVREVGDGPSARRYVSTAVSGEEVRDRPQDHTLDFGTCAEGVAVPFPRVEDESREPFVVARDMDDRPGELGQRGAGLGAFAPLHLPRQYQPLLVIADGSRAGP